MKRRDQHAAIDQIKVQRVVQLALRERRPSLLILVDFPEFNLRLAKLAKSIQVPVLYYVSPQVWASREGRINRIKKFVSMMVVLFKFEEEFYKQRGIQTACVGHPLIDLAKPALEKQEFLNNFRIDPSKKIIALLPGSRKQEIKIILAV